MNKQDAMTNAATPRTDELAKGLAENTGYGQNKIAPEDGHKMVWMLCRELESELAAKEQEVAELQRQNTGLREVVAITSPEAEKLLIARAEAAEAKLSALQTTGQALLQYLDDHDWGHVPEGSTSEAFRKALSGATLQPKQNGGQQIPEVRAKMIDRDDLELEEFDRNLGKD